MLKFGHFFLVFGLLLGLTNAEVTFSLNVTKVEPNQPVRARCYITGHSQSRGRQHKVQFMKNNYEFARIDVRDVPKFGLEKLHHSTQEVVQYYDDNFPNFEVGAKFAHVSLADQFFCNFYDSEGKQFKSNVVTNAEKRETNLTFSVNVTKVENNEPFLAKCEISNFDQERSVDYTVRFYRASDLTKRLIGTHEVRGPSASHPSQRHIFDAEILTDLTVHSGPHFAYPTYEIIVLPKSANKHENYWCELSTESKTYTSNVWANTPILEMSLTGNNPFTARCNISYFNPQGKTYSIEFYRKYSSDYSRLGTFVANAGQSEEFIPGKIDSFSVTHGEEFTFPTFDLKVSTTHRYDSGTYYCVLVVETDSASTTSYTSNLVKHSW